MKYGFDDYNEYNTLKIPLLLVLINIYLLKNFVIFVLPMILSIPAVKDFAHEQFSLALLFSGIPAAMVIGGMLRRIPETRSVALRWIWEWGRMLLLASLVMEIGFIILYVVLGLSKFNGVSLAFIYIDLVLIGFSNQITTDAGCFCGIFRARKYASVVTI